ncbi:MAG: Flp family type IVb pilin [Candidatus Brocadiaceae bacterium]
MTAIEYALIAGLMGLAVFAAWTTLKGKFNGTLTNVGAKLDSALANNKVTQRHLCVFKGCVVHNILKTHVETRQCLVSTMDLKRKYRSTKRENIGCVVARNYKLPFLYGYFSREKYQRIVKIAHFCLLNPTYLKTSFFCTFFTSTFVYEGIDVVTTNARKQRAV